MSNAKTSRVKCEKGCTNLVLNTDPTMLSILGLCSYCGGAIRLVTLPPPPLVGYLENVNILIDEAISRALTRMREASEAASSKEKEAGSSKEKKQDLDMFTILISSAMSGMIKQELVTLLTGDDQYNRMNKQT